MSVMRKITGGGTTLYPKEFQEMLDDLKLAKSCTDELVSSLNDLIKEYNCGNSMNRFEKVGDAMGIYSSKMTEATCASTLSSHKEGFDSIGRAWRIFARDTQEKVVGPLAAWTKGAYKGMNEEVRKLEKARSEMDSANDKVRKKPEDAEAISRQQATQAAHEAQLEVVKGALAPLTEYWESVGTVFVAFNEILSVAHTAEKTEIEKLAS